MFSLAVEGTVKGHVGQTGRRSWADTEQITRKAGRKGPRETDRVFLAPATVSTPVKTGFVS